MKITYYFDVISPYSCLAWTVLKRYQPIWKFELKVIPMFLGGVMQTTGNQPPAMLPARAVFQAQDLARNQSLYGVNMLPTPTNFFSEVARKIINCQRVMVAAQLHNEKGGENVDISALISSFTDGVHLNSKNRTEDNNLVIDDRFVKECCTNAGLSLNLADKLIADSKEKEAKAALIQNTEKAVEAGAYGSPTMIIESEGLEPFMVFGSDRFEQIASVTNKPYYGVNMQAKANL